MEHLLTRELSLEACSDGINAFTRNHHASNLLSGGYPPCHRNSALLQECWIPSAAEPRPNDQTIISATRFCELGVRQYSQKNSTIRPEPKPQQVVRGTIL